MKSPVANDWPFTEECGFFPEKNDFTGFKGPANVVK